MVFVETSFPRGGTIKPAKKEAEQDASNTIHFGAVTAAKNDKKLKPNKKEREEFRKQEIAEKQEKKHIEAVSAELLSFKSLKEGLSIMGCVKSIDTTSISVALPGRIIGKVPVTSVSNAYLSLINKYVNSESGESSENEYQPLTEIFSVGQIVATKVKKIDKTLSTNIVVELSLIPEDVHEDYRHNQVKKGMILSVAIAEKQEHGFIIETGVKNLRGFLPIEKVPVELRDDQHVGRVLFCKVDEVKSTSAASIVRFILINSEKNWIMKNFAEPNITYLLPSSIVTFKVSKILKNGLQGTLFDENFIGYINEHQLGIGEEKSFHKPRDFKVGSELAARILYVQPLTKLVYLTLNLQERFQITSTDGENSILPVGTIIKDAKVSHIGTGGIVLRINGKIKGVISFRSIRVDVKTNFDQDEILVKYSRDSEHRVRIIHYDPIDMLHICSVDPKVLNEKFFSLDDVNIGDFVKGKIVRKLNDGRYELRIGAIKSYLHPDYLAPSTTADQLQKNAELNCRIICKNLPQNEIFLTNRKELMDKKAPLLTSQTKIKLNGSFLGCVRKCVEDGWLVDFCSYIRGMVYKNNLSAEEKNTAEKFYIGQIAKFTIKHITSNANGGPKLTLGLSSYRVEPGVVLAGRVSTVQPTGLDVTFVSKNVNGFIPLTYLSDYPSLVHAVHKSYKCNDSIEAIGINSSFYSIRDVADAKPNSVYIKSWASVKIGDIISAFVKNVEDEVIDVECFITDQQKITKVHMDNFIENNKRIADINLVPDQKILVKIIGKNHIDKSLTISAQLHDVWVDGDFDPTVKFFQNYLRDMAQIRRGLEVEKDPIVNFKAGDIVEGELIVESKDVYVSQDSAKAVVKLRLEGGVTAILTHANTDIEIGKRTKVVAKKHKMLIVWIDYAQQIVYGTTKKKYIDRMAEERDETNAAELLKEHRGLKADILLILDELVVLFPRKVTKQFIYVPKRLHYNDFQPILTDGVSEGGITNVTCIETNGADFIGVFEHIYRLYKKFQIRVDARPSEAIDEVKLHNKAIKRKNIIQLDQSVDDASNDIENQEIAVAESAKRKKRKGKVNGESSLDSSIEEVTTSTEKKSKAKQLKTTKAKGKRNAEENKSGNEIKNSKKKRKISAPEPGFSLKLQQLDGCADMSSDEDEAEPATKPSWVKKAAAGKQNKKTALPGIKGFWNADLGALNQPKSESSSSEDDSDSESVPQSKKSKISAQDRFATVRAEETRLRQIERSYADETVLPTTTDQFDRLVMGEPNSSRIWIQYMVFHLQATELDRARGIARKALKTINFRETQERMNIWIAMLNLELRYGSKESFEEVLKEALRVNEPFNVYTACLKIFADCKRLIELNDCILTMTKKFRANPDCWITTAQAYFEVDLPEKAKPLLTRALTSLPERDHINTIVKFANLCNKNGQKDHAHALFEQILVSYPKRVDCWSQYIDLLTKSGDIDMARQTLDRAAAQKIPMKKMRTIFKKYLDFEEKYGSTDDVKKVKLLAANYIENEISV